MKAKTFTLKNQHGEDVTIPGEGISVLFFYPKAGTPGCMIESKKFSELNEEFEKAGATVYGISPDPHDKVCKFAEKHGMGQHMLADEDHKAAEAYGVWKKKSMFGNEFWGVKRTTFLIRDGEILKEYKHRAGKTEEQILEDIRELD